MKSLTRFALLFFVAASLVAGCNNPEDSYVQVPPPSPNLPGAPLIPEIAVLRPFFQTTLGNVDVGSAVGTAFAVKPEGSDSSIVLTAFSILGPSSGLSRQALPSELSEIRHPWFRFRRLRWSRLRNGVPQHSRICTIRTRVRSGRYPRHNDA